MPGTGGMPRRFAVAAWELSGFALRVESWRLCTPSGVHGPRGMWVNQPSAGTHWQWASERSDERHAQRGAPSARTGGHRPQNQLSGIPLLLNSAGIFVLFSAVGGSMSEIVVLPDIDYVESEVPGSSIGPPTRWCSPEARLSPTVSCPMSRRGSDATMAIDGLFVFWPCYSYLWSCSAFSVVPAVSLLTVLLVLLYSSVFLVS